MFVSCLIVLQLKQQDDILWGTTQQISLIYQMGFKLFECWGGKNIVILSNPHSIRCSQIQHCYLETDRQYDALNILICGDCEGDSIQFTSFSVNLILYHTHQY